MVVAAAVLLVVAHPGFVFKDKSALLRAEHWEEKVSE